MNASFELTVVCELVSGHEEDNYANAYHHKAHLCYYACMLPEETVALAGHSVMFNLTILNIDYSCLQAVRLSLWPVNP